MNHSPIEARAYEFAQPLPHVRGLMLKQWKKGHAEYGGPIDECGYTAREMAEAKGEEYADLVTYIYADTLLHGRVMPPHVARALLTVGTWLESELEDAE